MQSDKEQTAAAAWGGRDRLLLSPGASDATGNRSRATLSANIQQMHRHQLKEPAFAMPVATREMPLLQAVHLGAFSRLSAAAELQQPKGQGRSFQPVHGVSDQQQTEAGVICQVSKLARGLYNQALLFDSCTRLQVRHHQKDAIM